MSFKKSNFLIFLLFTSLFFIIKADDVIIVYPSDNNINQYCEKNSYYFDFRVTFSKPLEKVIPFEMIIPLPNRLPFKCVLDGPNKKIACFHSFSNYVWSISSNSRVELPYSFPDIEGIRWDYDMFLKNIYRYLWRTNMNCGLEYENSNQDGNVNNKINESNSKADLIGNIEFISGGKCFSSKYDYSFDMKVNLNGGEIFGQFKDAKANKKNIKVDLLHKIYVPVLLGEKKKKGTTTFKKDYEYKYSICNYDSEITQDNYDSAEGIRFTCHLTINKFVKFRGPLQIKPFTDFIYISITDKDGKNITKKIQMQFDILSSSNILEKEDRLRQLEGNGKIENENNLRNLDEKNDIKEPNFLILDSNLNEYICPDKPILTVQNYNDGIGFGGLNTSGSKYLFLIYGYLSNGYDFTGDTLDLLEMTKEEIKFYLKVTDNLESPDYKKKSVRCTIPTGTSINKNVLIEVKCIGNRAQLGNNNTDLVLNWNLEENNNFENIVIKWPYDLTKKKHIFYYNVQGLALKKEDYGCFENKYYFYLYVYDLKTEPKISFDLPLIYPKNAHAVCKLYNSVTFKCVIDLRLKRISKGEKIVVSNNIREYLPNKEQNIVLYYVNNNTSSSELDFMLPVTEDCGDFLLIGALKDIGYTYIQVVVIIISCFVGFLICVFGIAFCVIYEITHRNRKGIYFKYTEEKEIPNTSVSQTKSPA